MKISTSSMMVLGLLICFQLPAAAQKSETKTQYRTQETSEKEPQGPQFFYIELQITRDIKGEFLHADINYKGMERNLKESGNTSLQKTFMYIRKAPGEMEALNMLGEHGFEIEVHRDKNVGKNFVTSYILVREE